ncbi:receptor-like protein EIX2 [Cryptomeria japonica]|uniref:receptor-like protein EIX2 n=1 Tax=Cryptomeria japonica TaxID=3369 RepID=UPI0027DA871E|nr:receptor-like protein EIX2 [Cryptomeria japonica]
MDLSHNQLSGTIPESISMLASIEVLSLNYNHLTGKIPPSLCELLVLSELHLGHNQLSGTIPDSISKLASLEVLTLPSNRLRGNISLPMFDNLTRLQGLDLSENQFTIAISTSWVPQFGHLVYLGLRSCNIEGDFPPLLSQQYELEYLDLSSNYIVGNLPSWLWDLPYLRMLNLSYNQLEGSLPRKISHKFTVVDLKENKLYGSLPPLDFVSFMLDLSDNKFNGSIPATIGSIYFLSLSGNNLTGKIPSSICTDSNEWGILDFSNNKLTGMIPASIGLCSGLGVLKLAQNVLQGEIPEELGNLQTLSTLNLNGNRLEGIIPLSISNCTGLKVFDLGNNKFEGSIPVWIEKLTDLKILSLTSNNFKSTIPTQLMRLHNLQILDLSNNNLSGSIPQNLSKLYAMANQSQIIEVELRFSGSAGGLRYMQSVYESKYEDEITVWIKGRALTYGRIYNADKFMDLSGNNLSGCKENQTEWNNTANNDANVMDKWWAVGMGLSYGIGFATIIAVLCIHSEREALLHIKNNSSDSSLFVSLREKGTDCCDLYGISCSNTTHHVDAVHLFGLDTVEGGIVWQSLCTLTFLQTIDLSYNGISVLYKAVAILVLKWIFCTA